MDDMTVSWLILLVLTAMVIVYRIAIGKYMKASEELEALLRGEINILEQMIDNRDKLIEAQRKKIRIQENIIELSKERKWEFEMRIPRQARNDNGGTAGGQ